MVEEIRSKLRQLYEVFISKYGPLNRNKNKNIILKDEEYGLKILSSLEKRIDSEYLPADILYRSRYSVVEQIQTNDAKEALAYVLAMKGYVDMDLISDITDLETQEILNELGDMVYINPITNVWETSDNWLSGDVYTKMVTVENMIADHPDNEEYARSLKAIKEVQPEPIPWELLSDSLQLGERWIPMEKYTEYASWLFEAGKDITVEYFPSMDKFKMECRYQYQYGKITKEYYVRSKGGTKLNGLELLEHAMENTTPFFQYTVGSGSNAVKMVDNDAIQLANEKIEEMRSKWTEWLEARPKEEKDELVALYNNTYNCYVLRKYDGSHMTLPGLDLSKLGKGDTPIELYPAQKNVIWRLVQQVGGIVDHQVGSGKTLSAVCAAHEMKRMKIRKKPAILCLKANIADVTKTYRKAYPHAKVLAPDEQAFEKKNRRRLFHEIKNNDWDCVIMTHDQFGRIPQSKEIQEEIIQEEIDNLERDLDSLNNKGYEIRRSMRSGLEKRKATLNAKLRQIRKQIEDNKDDDVTFADMGIDHLFIDEAHKFKNLTFTTRHDRVAGLGNSTGSQKALNMLFAIRELQKRFNSDLQATFLSGTPISNSLTEMYLLFKYLRPRELAKQNILNFDAWAAVYAKKTTEFEFSVTNQIIAKERFRHFIKVPELALFYNAIADYRTKKMMGIQEPEMVEELVNLEPTEDQKEYIVNLIKFAETGDASYIDREPLSEGEKAAKMLIATNLAKKMSTDMRLIDKDKYDDHPLNKISVCCRRVSKFYREFHDKAGTQLIFCDLGTPGTDGYNVYKGIKDKLVEIYEIPAEEIQFIHDWEGERKKIELFRKMNSGDIRILIGSTEKAGTGLNVQQRIVAMHHMDIPWKPAELTQRNGRGVRPGNWVAELHQNNKVYNYIYATERSLDTYKFTLLKNKQTFISQMKMNELQVRSIDEGSIDEQSGMNFAEYIAVLSGDTTLLEKAKIDKKLAVLENLRTAHYREQHNNEYTLNHKRERKEVVDEIVSGLKRDTELYLSSVQYDDTGTKLNPIDIPAIRSEVLKAEGEELRYQIEKQERKLLRELGMKADKQVTDEESVETEEQQKTKEKRKDVATIVGEWLIETHRSWRPQSGQRSQLLGTLMGFNCYIERIDAGAMVEEEALRRSAAGMTLMSSNKLYAEHPDGGLKYSHNHGIPSRENPKIAARSFITAIARCESTYEQYAREQSNLETDIRHLSQLQVKPFSKEDEIRSLKEESKRLMKQIQESINKTNMATDVKPVPAVEESVVESNSNNDILPF